MSHYITSNQLIHTYIHMPFLEKENAGIFKSFFYMIYLQNKELQMVTHHLIINDNRQKQNNFCCQRVCPTYVCHTRKNDTTLCWVKPSSKMFLSLFTHFGLLNNFSTISFSKVRLDLNNTISPEKICCDNISLCSHYILFFVIFLNWKCVGVNYGL